MGKGQLTIFFGTVFLMAVPALAMPPLICEKVVADAGALQITPSGRKRLSPEEAFVRLAANDSLAHCFPEYVRNDAHTGVWAHTRGAPYQIFEPVNTLQVDFMPEATNKNVTPLFVHTAPLRLLGLARVDWDHAATKDHQVALLEIVRHDPDPGVRAFARRMYQMVRWPKAFGIKLDPAEIED